jgi:hypothetical protein
MTAGLMFITAIIAVACAILDGRYVLVRKAPPSPERRLPGAPMGQREVTA